MTSLSRRRRGRAKTLTLDVDIVDAVSGTMLGTAQLPFMAS